LHDLAGDVAGVIKAIGCGPVHLIGHAFGNRIARCLAVDQPSLVRSVTLLAAGGLIAPSTPSGTSFRNATQAKMNGSDCVTTLGARWLSPASDPKVLEQVECWPAGPYRASRDQPERAPRILVERRHCPPSRDPRCR
jgi:pimeloyl-ACP methyl ester carboxylesterase